MDIALRPLNTFWSSVVAAYFRGPDHPCKLRLLNWGLTIFGRPVIVVNYANTARIALDPRDFLQSKILADGLYEPEVWDSFVPWILEGDVLWDIGAHIGSFALRAASDPKIKEVRCFEPNPKTREHLTLNKNLNNFPIIVEEFALSDTRGERKLFAGVKGNTGTASFENRFSDDGVVVQCTTIDEYLENTKAAPPTLLKVDIERGELALFKGAVRLFSSEPPRLIVFETEASSDQELGNPVFTLLREYGYSITHVKRPEGVLDDVENYLALRSPTSP